MGSRLKIAHVTPYFLPTVGGIKTYIYELLRKLAEDNDMYVMTYGEGGDGTLNGVKVVRLKAIDIQNLPLNLKIPYPIPPTLIF